MERKPGKRAAMLSSVVREIIAPMLRECPLECGIVSITHIDVSSDASYATVYLSSLKFPEKALAFLKSQANRMQKQLGSLDRKKIPLLRFRTDTSLEQGNRIDDLLREQSQ